MIRLNVPLHELTDGIDDADELIDNLPEEFTLYVDYSFDPGRPAKTFGYPEDCYPAEGPEVEFSDDPQDLTRVVMDGLPSRIFAPFSDQLFILQKNIHAHIEAWIDGTGIDAVIDYESDRHEQDDCH